VSFLGFQSQSVAVEGRTSIDITLVESAEQIDDVVVIGYGTQLRSDVTGAIASVRAADLNNRSASDAGQALQGKAAGVFIMNLGGAPGEGTNIRVRGMSSSTGNNGPLLVVDGLKVDNIQYLEPSMIESMEVLKDAASAAIYGAEAGNGVVLITTKRGKQGEGRIFYNYQHTISSLGRMPQMMNAEQFIGYQGEANIITKSDLETFGYYDNPVDTNWAKEVFGTGVTARHTIGFEGGNERGSYYMAIGNLNDNGMMRGDADVYKRLSAQINADYKIKSWLQVGTNVSFEKWSRKSVSERTAFVGVLPATIINDPLTPVYYDSIDDLPASLIAAINEGKNVMKGENGKYYATSKYVENDSGNPFIQRDRDMKDINGGVNTRGSFFANFTPVSGLVFTSRFGFRLAQSFSRDYTMPYYANSMAKEDNHGLSNDSNNSWYYQWENFANYNKRFGKHNVGAMAGMSYIESTSHNLRARVSGPNPLASYEDNFLYLNYRTAGASIEINGNSPSRSASIAYFGRLSYSYDNRYMIQANFRADALDSSRLPKNARWGYFPSVSVGWTVTNEAWVKDFARRISMDNLRLRASWGRNGNISSLRDYRYNATVSVNNRYYQFGGDSPNLTYGSTLSGLVNPKLRWEQSDQIDIGLNAEFLNNRLSFGVDYFDKRTKDLLVQITPPREVGVDRQWVNGGEVSNKGFEFELGWQDHIGGFRYSINGNLATLRNRVLWLDPSLAPSPNEIFSHARVFTIFEAGQPIWYLRGYKYLGVDYESGEPIYENVDGSTDAAGNPTITDADVTKIGSGIPDFTYGLTINMSYKNFDFTAFGMGVAGNEIFSGIHRTDRPRSNSLAMFYEQRWTPQNKNAKMPSPISSAQDMRFWSSTANIFNGSYFKIKQLQLGYTIPSRLTNKAFVQSLRVFVSLDDFFVISKYPGFDPETSNANSSEDLGADIGAYPIPRKLMFGVNISF
jgi:TonB-linked SusC/RagA family outer membrane protein